MKTPKVQVDTLVITQNASVGIVTKLTRKWVHVAMLINNYAGEPNYHCVKFFKRQELTTMAPGHKISVTNKE